MQYFEAVRRGELVAQRAQHFLSTYTGYAVAAMMVKESKHGWVPVGEENLYAIVEKEGEMAVVVVCDSDGYVKAMSNPFPRRVAQSIASKMEKDGLKKYTGPLVLPI
ncbi:MAG: hypothetical protein QXF45_02035 [Candidatus Caldarchaeum sp.]